MSQDGNWSIPEGEQPAKLSDGRVDWSMALPPPYSDELMRALGQLAEEPQRKPWYKRLYYRAADRVWGWRFRLAEKIAGCDIECN